MGILEELRKLYKMNKNLIWDPYMDSVQVCVFTFTPFLSPSLRSFLFMKTYGEWRERGKKVGGSLSFYHDPWTTKNIRITSTTTAALQIQTQTRKN